MDCQAEKGYNLKICVFGIPWQEFYCIQIPSDDAKNKNSFPGILMIREGIANEEIIGK
jgi:hypothetical protein